MRGQIINRGENTWLVRLYLGPDASGKRRTHNKTIKGSKKDAERYRTKKLGELDNGTFVETSKATVVEHMARWLAETVSSRVRKRTHRDYGYVTNRYIVPTLGRRRISELRPAEIQRFYASLTKDGLSPRTVRAVHATLRSALNQAVCFGELGRNPCVAVELPRQIRREQRVLTPEEARIFLNKARGTRWYALWHLLLTTGLRPAEALALRWKDAEGGAIRVRRSLVRLKGEYLFEEPKTKTSRRTVPMMAETVAVLQAHRVEQGKRRLALGAEYRSDLDLVFASSVGEPLQLDHLRQCYFRPLLKAARVTAIRVYDLRHSHATHLLLQNVHPKVVSERLGHSSILLTMDTYSHVLPQMQQDAVSKLEMLLTGS